MRFITIGLLLFGLVAGGIWKLTRGSRLIFVAPVGSALAITVDTRRILIEPRKYTDVYVGWGKHTILTDSADEQRTLTVEGNLSETLLVPVSEHQCFVVMNVSEAYSEAAGHVIPAGWRPPVEDVITSGAPSIAPKHIWITDAPKQISREPGEPARILYPYDCDESDPAAVVDYWMSETFKIPLPPGRTHRAPRAPVAPPAAKVSIEINSEPPGAEVLVDGVLGAQLTPSTVSLVPGAHVLVRKDGFVQLARTAPASGTMVFSLNQAGSLSVTSTPAGASVNVDGRDVGQTPLKLTTVEPGLRSITVSAREFVAAERKIEVTLDKTAELDVTLTAGAHVELLTSPQQAYFSIDGSSSQPTRPDVQVEAGRQHFLVLSAPNRLPRWEVIGPFTGGAQESLVFELDDRSDEGLLACARASERNLQRIKKEQNALQPKPTGAADRKLQDLQAEWRARTTLKDLCRKQL